MSDIYPVPRPKILTAITIPTGGWDMRIQFSVTTQYDTNIDFTLAAGTYFMAWDSQSDDFMYELNSKLYAAMAAEATIGGGATDWNGWECLFYLNTSNKVIFACDGDNFDATAAAPGARRDVKIAWTYGDGSSIADVLGFTSASDLALTGSNNNTTTADYQHGYAWYASDDGMMENLPIETNKSASIAQAVAGTGQVVTHRFGARETSNMNLAFVPREEMFSNGVGYAEAPEYPYAYNVPLECWWQAARDGTQFRVYRDGQNNSNKAVDGGIATVGTEGYIEDSAKAWATATAATPTGPADRWAGRLLYQPAVTSDNLTIPGRAYIASNTTIRLTLDNDQIGDGNDGDPFEFEAAQYYVMEQTYETFVLDAERMSEFAPDEIPNIDRFNLTIPLRKYVA